MEKEWEAIASDGEWTKSIVERCYALHCKPLRELTRDEIDDIGEPFGLFASGDSRGDKRYAFAKAIEQAHQRKQREPETVELILRTYRKPDGGYETLTNEYPGNEMWAHVATTKLEVTLP